MIISKSVGIPRDAHMQFLRGGMLVVLALIIPLGCVGPTVRTDFDSHADFRLFRTYAFTEMIDLNQGGVLANSLVRKRVEQKLSQQLSNKGLVKVGEGDNPDLLVHYSVGKREIEEIRSSGGTGGPYKWGAGYIDSNTYRYTEGTLIVDLVASTKNELVWRASMIGTLADSKEKNIQMVDEAIAKAFENYPPKMTTP